MPLCKHFALSNVLREDATIRFAISLLVCKFCPLLFISYARGGGGGAATKLAAQGARAASKMWRARRRGLIVYASMCVFHALRHHCEISLLNLMASCSERDAVEADGHGLQTSARDKL